MGEFTGAVDIVPLVSFKVFRLPRYGKDAFDWGTASARQKKQQARMLVHYQTESMMGISRGGVVSSDEDGDDGGSGSGSSTTTTSRRAERLYIVDVREHGVRYDTVIEAHERPTASTPPS